MFVYIYLLLLCISSIVNEDILSMFCKTPNDDVGVCVSIFSCPNLLKTMASLEPSKIQFVQQSICGESSRNLLICCGITDLQVMNLEKSSKENDTIENAAVDIKLENANISINFANSDSESKLTLTFKTDEEGSSNFNLNIKSKQDSLEQEDELQGDVKFNKTFNKDFFGLKDSINNGSLVLNPTPEKTTYIQLPLNLQDTEAQIQSVFTQAPKQEETQINVGTTESLDELFDSIFGVKPSTQSNQLDTLDNFNSNTKTQIAVSSTEEPKQEQSEINVATTQSLEDLFDLVFGPKPGTELDTSDDSDTAPENKNEGVNVTLENFNALLQLGEPKDLLYTKNSNRSFAIKNLLPSQENCGIHLPDSAIPEDYPWLVYLLYDSKRSSNASDYSFECGGVLINQRYVLTSVYCVKQINGASIGLYSKNSSSCDQSVQQDVSPIEIDEVIHRWYADWGWYEFALVRLAKNLTFSDCIRPICLPLTKDDEKPAQEALTVSVWETEPGSTKQSLKYVNVDNQKCYNNNPTIEERSANISLICTDNENNTVNFATAYEEGGPLMYQRNSRWFLDGIITTVFVPYGEKDATNADLDGIKITPNVTDWILDNIKP